MLLGRLENGNVFLYKFRNRVCSIYLEQTGRIVVALGLQLSLTRFMFRGIAIFHSLGSKEIIQLLVRQSSVISCSICFGSNDIL